MPKVLRKFKREQWAGLLFVLALHAAVLYGLWSYRIILAPDEVVTLMVNLISQPPPEQPEPPKPKPSEPPKPRLPEPPPPEHQHLAVEAPVAQADEPVTYVPPPPPPVMEAPPLPPQPLVLSGELAVTCPERTPPVYPLLSRRRNEQGKVVLRVELGEDGRVAGVSVKTSSGYPRLDEAALSAVRNWRCKPATRDGVAVRAVALQPFNFMLGEE